MRTSLNRLVASLAIAFLALVAILAPDALADPILSTNVGVSGGGPANSYGNLVAQEFMLTGNTTIADFVITGQQNSGGSAADMVMEIYSGGTDSSLGTLEYTSESLASLPSSIGSLTFDFASPVSVSAGTYWAVLDNTNSSDSGGVTWYGSSVNSVSNCYGSITSDVYVSGSYYSGAQTLQIDTPAAVPEPASLAMVACGLGVVGVTAIRRRRRAATA